MEVVIQEIIGHNTITVWNIAVWNLKYLNILIPSCVIQVV